MVATQVGHALDQLSVEEIATAVQVIRRERHLTGPHRFNLVTLAEPTKAELNVAVNGHRTRKAFAVVLDSVERAGFEAVVSLAEERLLSWTRIESGQPPILMNEFLDCEAAVRADPDVQAALRRRGVEDMSLVWVDPWSAGHYTANETGQRLTRALIWVKNDPDDGNGYAHPVENLAVTVDLHEMRIVAIEDGEVVPVPRGTGNYGTSDVGPLRSGLKPLDIVQADGPSFEVDGYAVRWQNWRFRIGFTPREGLVLHEVGWESGDRVRPVLHRASVSEMVVPYGDPALTHQKKNAFDVGEYNIGALANSLKLGCDCLGLIRYFDAPLVADDGTPYVLANAICMHEDAPVGWSSPSGPRSAITITASSGISTRTAGSRPRSS
jgi:primary-amine oxidase